MVSLTMQTIWRTVFGWAVIRGPIFNLNWRSADIARAQRIRADFWAGLTAEEVGQLNGGN